MVGIVGGAAALTVWATGSPGDQVHEGATTGQLLASADGRTLTLSIGWGCERQPELLVRELPDKVRVSIKHTVPATDPPGLCDPMGGYARITAHLKAPLGNKPLIDAVTGRPVVHFDGRNLALPTYLPDHYFPYPQDQMAQIPGLEPFPEDRPNWATGYHVGTEPGVGASLIVRQTRGAGPAPAGRPTTVVKGHPATFTSADPNLGPRSLTWFDGTYTFTVSTGAPVDLSDQELVRVAESLK
ncbi:hypothetical protein ABTZ03_10080 [Kitasatospora sp. NPDC096077]|uniref:hypothetical protein n=1 Tax=Kitasatospora sp. NPDC096077 TaxID=3155544 RepID=UPI003321FC87